MQARSETAPAMEIAEWLRRRGKASLLTGPTVCPLLVVSIVSGEPMGSAVNASGCDSSAFFARQEVDLENKSIVVDVLCTSSVAYANQWKLMRAEDLAVEAVQQAKYVLLYFVLCICIGCISELIENNNTCTYNHVS